MTSCRIHTVRFATRKGFLEACRTVDGVPGLLFASRAHFEPGEDLVLELRFPGQPNRSLLKAIARPDLAPKGSVAVQFPKEEHQKFAFLRRIARHPDPMVKKRKHRRFPVSLPAAWRLEDVDVYHTGSVLDASFGGLKVESSWAPPVGSAVQIRFQVPNQEQELKVWTKVVWTLHGSLRATMGLAFRPDTQPDLRYLRAFLRTSSSKGRLPVLPRRTGTRHTESYRS